MFRTNDGGRMHLSGTRPFSASGGAQRHHEVSTRPASAGTLARPSTQVARARPTSASRQRQQVRTMFGGGSGGSAAHMLAAQRAEAASASAKAEAADVHSGFIASARGWGAAQQDAAAEGCLLYTSPSPRDRG